MQWRFLGINSASRRTKIVVNKHAFSYIGKNVKSEMCYKRNGSSNN